jgi:hypothetical protein
MNQAAAEQFVFVSMETCHNYFHKKHTWKDEQACHTIARPRILNSE